MNPLFKDIDTATPAGRSDNIRPGIYDYVVNKIVAFNGQKGYTVVAELKVSSAKAKEPGIEPNAVGSTVGYVQIPGQTEAKRKSMAAGNVQKFICALFNVSKSDLQPAGYKDANGKVHEDSEFAETLQDLLSDAGQIAQKARGMMIHGETYQSENGHTYVNFSGVANTAESIAKNRAALAAGDSE